MKLKHLRYGWVMVIIGVCVLAATSVVLYSFGIFLRPLAMEFDCDRGALSGAFSMSLLLIGFLGIPSGRLSDKYGPRILVTLGGLILGIGLLLMSRISSLWQIYLTWGLFVGIGASCCHVPILSTIPRWFGRRRGIAIGISVAGIGLGGMISPPLAQWFISSYGWRQALLLLSLITFIIIIPLAQFMRHSPQGIRLKPYGENGTTEDKQSLATISGLSFRRAIKIGRFWGFGLILFCCGFCEAVILVHFAPYAVDIGILPIVAATILSIIAANSVIGRISIGFISDRVGGRLTLSACLITMILALIWLLFAEEIWMFYLFALIFGLAYGGIMSLATIVTAELFGLKFLGVIFGSVMLLYTVGGALGAPLAGSIFDITGGYSLALLICMILSILAFIFSLNLLRYKN
jgi:MFS family permease